MLRTLYGRLRREPVRLRLYTVTVTIVALLVAYDRVAADKAPLWLGLAAAVLAVESARRRVTPVGRHRRQQ